jgi:hypothetical protein
MPRRAWNRPERAESRMGSKSTAYASFVFLIVLSYEGGLVQIVCPTAGREMVRSGKEIAERTCKAAGDSL